MKRLLSALLLLAAANAAAGEKSVSLERNFGTLYGTLLTPDEGAETVAVLIAGSGPTPRNGNTNNYLYLAQELEKAGIATLRYDKRGIGSSKFDDPDKMADATLDDFIGDAAAWAEYLSRQDFRRIVLIGHSEGALIAFCAAQQCPEVDAVISLAGAGYPLDEILQLQLAAQLAPTHMELLMQARAITAALKRGERVESCPPELTPLFAPPLQTFWISSLSYDPREEIRKVRVPVLIVNGDIDFQVTPDNADALAKAQPRSRKTIIEGMTHTLKKASGPTRTRACASAANGVRTSCASPPHLRPARSASATAGSTCPPIRPSTPRPSRGAYSAAAKAGRSRKTAATSPCASSCRPCAPTKCWPSQAAAGSWRGGSGSFRWTTAGFRSGISGSTRRRDSNTSS